MKRPAYLFVLAILGIAVLSAATGAQQSVAPNGNGSALRFEVTSVRETSTPLAPGEPGGIHANMEYLCWWLGLMINRIQQIDRPVLDQTGLKGYYDFTLTLPEFSAPSRPNGEPLSALEDPNVLKAVREQLGLKMENSKGPVLVFVIDHVEKPAGN
jgi:hypothetical protein